MGPRHAVLAVIQQHIDECVSLRHTRSVLARAPHVRLHHLRRLDDRIAANFDGLAEAGAIGSTLCQAGLASPGKGSMFVATLLAIATCDEAALGKLMAVAEAVPPAYSGMLSAFGWMPSGSVQDIARKLLDSSSAIQRQTGLAICAMHQTSPGAMLVNALQADHAALRARALRTAADQGLVNFMPACVEALADENAPFLFEAARASLLLGDRGASVAVLQRMAAAPGLQQTPALKLVLKTLASQQAHAALKALSQDEAQVRALVQGVGAAGDPHYIPWLIKQMTRLKLARLAGESFSLITGLDLAYLDLERKPPEDIEFGPNDNPNDDDVAMDEDDSLPWPDPVKITAWWQANCAHFTSSTRYFMGEVPSSQHCLAVLRTGFQRQRVAAAEYLCLLQPGTPFFNIAAPAWRQQQLLVQMGA